MQAAKIRRANSLVSRLTRAHRVKADSSLDSFAVGQPHLQPSFSLKLLNYSGGPDVEDLLTARVEMEQLEVRETAAAQLEKISVPLSLVVLTMFAYLIAGKR